MPVSRRRVLVASGAFAIATPWRARAAETAAPPRPGRDAIGSGEAWPTRALRLVVPQAPGGTADAVARMFGDRLEPVLGIPVVVDNRPGANGIIAGDAVRRAAADGATMLVASTHTFVIAPMVSAGEAFDPLRDFMPVANLATQTKVLLVSTATPATTAMELVEVARRRAGVLNYASTGVGSASHLDTELFARSNGLELVHVPYRGSGQSVAAVAANEVQVLFASVTAALGAVRAGQVRALAILAARRSPLLPDVPTLAETGLPTLDVQTWLGIVAPAGTPPAIVGSLNDALVRIVERPEMRAWFAAQGLDPIGGTPEAFAAAIRSDREKWGRLVERLGIARR